jgi:thiamine kinase-like enzyme
VRMHGARTDLLGIDRDGERLANEAAARLGIAPAVAAAQEGCLVTDFVAGAAVPAEAVQAIAEEVGRALRRFHDSGASLPSRFDVRALLGDYAAEVVRRGGSVPEDYLAAQRAAERIASAVHDEVLRPCHNDLLAGNIMRTDDQRVLLVDWEYAAMGHPCFDLGNLSVNNEFQASDDVRLLAAYHGREPTSAERATLKLMGVLSDAREAAWGVLQGVISELDFDFDAYARAHFERLRAAVQDPAFEDWLAGANA